MDRTPYIIETSSASDASALMAEIGVAAEGIDIMAPAVPGQLARVDGLEPHEAVILKQEALALGGDAALPTDAYHLQGESCNALVMATDAQLTGLGERLALHGGVLADLGSELLEAVENRRRLDGDTGLPRALGDGPWLVMGILNVTPDSFYDGGRHAATDAALEHAMAMADAGAGIIDVGGESTRPGAGAVSERQELDRVLPVIEGLVSRLDRPISIDTSKAGVARRALAAGATMVNDVTGLGGDGEMAAVVAEHGCPVCIMHMQGSPRDMQDDPRYDDVVGELVDFFHRRIEWAAAQGIARENIIIDPGIGFGKTLEHNLILLRRLDAFRSLGQPLLVGASRKSFIGMVTGDMSADRLAGTIAANVQAYGKGARIFRVHDVAANLQALRVAAAAMDGDGDGNSGAAAAKGAGGGAG